MSLSLNGKTLLDIEQIEIVNGLQDLRESLKEKQQHPKLCPQYYVKRIALIEQLILKLGGGLSE